MFSLACTKIFDILIEICLTTIQFSVYIGQVPIHSTISRQECANDDGSVCVTGFFFLFYDYWGLSTFYDLFCELKEEFS